jgi:hypothetical protein
MNYFDLGAFGGFANIRQEWPVIYFNWPIAQNQV